jgi:uncharacterized protein (TIGR02099 family)
MGGPRGSVRVIILVTLIALRDYFRMLTPPWLTTLPARLLRWLAWGLLSLSLLVGITWAVMHFWIVPRITALRPQLESMASKAVGLPVMIGELTVQSNGWAPVLEIDNLRIHNAAGQTALTLPKVRITVSVQSLLTLGVEQLALEGAELDLRRTEDGQLWIAGWPVANTSATPSAAANWLLAQKELVLRQGTLLWTDALSLEPQRTVAMTAVHVTLKSGARSHQLSVQATPPEGWGAPFSASGQFRRGLLSTQAARWQDWSGTFEAQLPHIDLGTLGRSVATGIALHSGQGALRWVLDVLNGQAIKASADVDMKNLSLTWGAQLKPMQFAALQGHVTGRHDAQGFEISTQALRFDTPDDLHWPGGDVLLNYTYPQSKALAKGQFKATGLHLQALQSLLQRLPLEAEQLQQLQSVSVAGSVETLNAQWQGQWPALTTYEATGRVHDLTWALASSPSPANKLLASVPGVHNAVAEFSLNQTGGKLALGMDKGSITLNGLLQDPRIALDTLKADMRWRIKDHLLTIPQWRVKASNIDLALDVNGSWRMRTDGEGPGVIDLQGQIQRAEAAQLAHYLPQVLSEDVRHYVRDAFTQGQLTQMAVRIKGDLKDFPFTNPKTGELRFAGKLRGVQMAYVPARLQDPGEAPWPALTGLNGDVVFDRLSMKVSNASAKLGGVAFSNVQASMADMAHAAPLEVTAEARNALASEVLGLVQKSPLDAMLGASLHDTRATGNVNGRIKLSVPLENLKKIKLQGSVVLNGNDLRLVSALPKLEKTQGTLSFNENGFTVTAGMARTLGGSLRVDGGSQVPSPDGNEAPISLRVQGTASAEGLQQAVELAPLNTLARHMSGSAAYSAVIGFRQGHPELSLSSRLQGLGISLPAPMVKAPADELALRLDTRLIAGSATPALREHIQLNLGRLLAATYVREWRDDKARVVQGSLGVGLDRVQAPALPDSGVVANMAFQVFSLDAWQTAWAGTGALPAETRTDSPVTKAPNDVMAASFLPTRMALQAQELVVQGRTLHNVVVGGSREGLLWRANVDARELNGYLEYRQSSGANLGRVYARLRHLSLPPTTDTAVEELLESGPVEIPALDIVVEELELRGKKLGRIEIEAINMNANADAASGPRAGLRGHEWRLNKLNLTVPEASFSATGRWVSAKDNRSPRQTEMNFRLDVSDSGGLLNRLGTQDAMRAGNGRLEGQVAWQGSPLALHYPSLSGRFNVSLAKGQFLKADPGVAKLLGVLSLQSLPRRLLLDFRDVFSEGFSYDVIRGDVTIEGGLASTRNLEMKGVNAVVKMEGTSDIAKETQNVRVLILPEVDAGTASLIAGFTVNPIIGLSTFLAQWFLHNPLSKAAAQTFQVDGTWSQPKVTKLEIPTGPAAK